AESDLLRLGRLAPDDAVVADLYGPERFAAARRDDITWRRFVTTAHLALDTCVRHFLEHECSGIRLSFGDVLGNRRAFAVRFDVQHRRAFLHLALEGLPQHAIALVEQPQLGLLVARA